MLISARIARAFLRRVGCSTRRLGARSCSASEPERRARLLCRGADSEWLAGQRDRAIACLAEAAAACFHAGDPVEMQLAADRARAVLPAGASVRSRFLAATAVGMARILGGDAAAGAGAIAQAIALAEGSAELRDDLQLVHWVVVGPVFLRESGVGRPLIEHALRTARARSAVGVLPFALNLVARDQATPDRWAVAESTYQEAIELARESGQKVKLAFGLAGLAWLQGRRGRERECRACAAEALERRARNRVLAREQLRAAIETFERLDADPWADRACAELAATGETLRRRDPSTVEELTRRSFRLRSCSPTARPRGRPRQRCFSARRRSSTTSATSTRSSTSTPATSSPRPLPRVGARPVRRPRKDARTRPSRRRADARPGRRPFGARPGPPRPPPAAPVLVAEMDQQRVRVVLDAHAVPWVAVLVEGSAAAAHPGRLRTRSNAIAAAPVPLWRSSHNDARAGKDRRRVIV